MNRDLKINFQMNQPGYNDFYYEEVEEYTSRSLGEYLVTKEAILDFANQWDPLIFHTDEEIAKTTPHGGLIAPGTLLLAIRIRLLHSGGINRKVLASVGFENVKFTKPAYVGDRLTLKIELEEKRVSRSRPQYGLAKYSMELVNQLGEPVLTMLDTIMIERDPKIIDV